MAVRTIILFFFPKILLFLRGSAVQGTVSEESVYQNITMKPTRFSRLLLSILLGLRDTRTSHQELWNATHRSQHIQLTSWHISGAKFIHWPACSSPKPAERLSYWKLCYSQSLSIFQWVSNCSTEQSIAAFWLIDARTHVDVYEHLPMQLSSPKCLLQDISTWNWDTDDPFWL